METGCVAAVINGFAVLLAFACCIGGPDSTVTLTTEMCQLYFDRDNDCDVDLADFAAIQNEAVCYQWTIEAE